MATVFSTASVFLWLTFLRQTACQKSGAVYLDSTADTSEHRHLVYILRPWLAPDDVSVNFVWAGERGEHGWGDGRTPHKSYETSCLSRCVTWVVSDHCFIPSEGWEKCEFECKSMRFLPVCFRGGMEFESSSHWSVCWLQENGFSQLRRLKTQQTFKVRTCWQYISSQTLCSRV